MVLVASSPSGASSEAGERPRRSLPSRFDGGVQLLSKFLLGGIAAELSAQANFGLRQMIDAIGNVNREANRFALARKRATDLLANPQRGVGGKLAAFGRIKFLDGLHQTDVALVDQVEDGHPEVFVLAGDFDHEAEVGADHVLASGGIAALDALGERDLFRNGQERHLPCFAHVDGEQRVLIRASLARNFRRGGRLDLKSGKRSARRGATFNSATALAAWRPTRNAATRAQSLAGKGRLVLRRRETGSRSDHRD